MESPEWTQVQVVTKVRYLGFMAAPGKGDLSWEEASVKYEGRVTVWPHQHLGLHGAAMTYNVFALSVLTFLAQLESPPDKVIDAEKKMLRTAASGPGNWCVPADLWYLRELYGQTRSFGSVAQMAKAAQVRVATWEAYRTGGLRINARAAALRREINSTEYLDRLWEWGSWYKRSHLLILQAAVTNLERHGHTATSIIDDIAGDAEIPWSREVRRKTRTHFQRAVLRHIKHAEAPLAEHRLRGKLERWKLDGPPGTVSRQVLRRLQQLQGLVAPRVSACCFSTIWNRWTTKRRFQRRHCTGNGCVFGCPAGAEDSLEHYAHCVIIRDFAWRTCKLVYTRDAFFLAGTSHPWQGSTTEALVRMAIVVYAA
jgi:hypothetical protein